MGIDTSEPLRAALHQGVDANLLVDTDVELLSHDLPLMAHGWALKHWRLEQTLQCHDYVTKQTALVLNAIVGPGQRQHCQHLLAPR